MNPQIPTIQCFKCGVKTNETQSVFGVGHQLCYDIAINNISNGSAVAVYLTKTYIEFKNENK